MKRSLLLAGLLAAPVALSATSAHAQSKPYVLIGDAYTPETNGGSYVRFPLVLSTPSSTPVSFQWKTQDGNAKAGSDYVASSGTFTFAPGQRFGLIEVPTLGDKVEEPDEYFKVLLSNGQGLTIADSVANAGISDDDYAGTISVADATKAEGNSGITYFGFQITLSQPCLHPIVIGYQTADGSAKVSSDYNLAVGVVQIDTGYQNKAVNVAVKGDTAVEGNETFFVKLGSPNYTLARPTATGTILNDDSSAKAFAAPSAGPA